MHEYELQLKYNEAARRNMLPFMMRTYDGYMVNWHHRLICRIVDDWVAGAITRLIINVPPRHGKSAIISERLPAYILGREPSAKIIAASYTQDLIKSMSRSVQLCIASPHFKAVFPNTKIGGKHISETVKEWETTLGGVYKCSGVCGGITGYGFNFGLIDDPYKDRAEAESSLIRDNVWAWYQSTFSSRGEGDERILLIQTRWHEDDLTGRLLKKAKEDTEADQWSVIDLPAILDRLPMLGDIRQQGEALWPYRRSIKKLKSLKANMGSYDFYSIYQQRPQPPGGGKIKRDWFEIVDEYPESLIWYRFWDLAFTDPNRKKRKRDKNKKKPDYTSSIIAARGRDGNFYLKDMIRGQWEWPETRRIIKQTSLTEGCVVGVEEAGQQIGFIDDLNTSPDMVGVALKGYRPDKSKLLRALPWAAKAEAGRVRLVRGTWVNEFLNECQSFTGNDDDRDDQVDCVSGVFTMMSDYAITPESISSEEGRYAANQSW